LTDAELSHLGKTALKVLIPLAGIVVVLLVARRRKLSLREDVGIRPAPLGTGALWVAAAVAWMLGTNYFMNWRGAWDFTVWHNAPWYIDAMRVIGVGLLGPIMEELVFRGLFFGYLGRTRLDVRISIALLAAGWALMHMMYTPGVIAVIFIFGLLLGAARWKTKSIYVPIAMHIAWNMYAIW
jgi:membrane protease YdiL (CAAX protease family)